MGLRPPKYSTTALLRFPLVFASILGLLGVGFTYRESFMGDIESQRRELFSNQDVEGAKLYREKVEQMKKERLKV